MNHHFVYLIETSLVGTEAYVEAVEHVIVDAALVLLDEEVMVLGAVRRCAINATRVQANRARGGRRADLHQPVPVAFSRSAQNIISLLELVF